MTPSTRTLAALTVLAVSQGGIAGTADVRVPLTVPYAVIGTQLAQVLELDESGRASLSADECNRADLADPNLGPGTEGIEVSLGLAVTTGARVFGRCRGPGPWQGRINLVLVPALAGAGGAIAFSVRSADLVRPSGSPGLLTPASRLLAEQLILPRVERLTLDLTGPLAALDELLAAGFHDRPGVLGRIGLAAVNATPGGLEAVLALAVSAGSPPVAEPALDEGELARWQRLEDELDGFLTIVISALADQAGNPELRLEMLAVMLDARYRIAEALVDGAWEGEGASDGERDVKYSPEAGPETDSIRRLFVDIWDQLRPWLAELDGFDHPGLKGGDLALASFVAGGDVLRAVDALGPEYGLVISRDGLRRLARMLLAERVPESFTPLPLAVDPRLRGLFGLDRPAPPATGREALASLVHWLLPVAHATDTSPAEALRGLVPRRAILDEYLELVARLLEQQARDHLSSSSRLPARLESRFEPLVQATAWKESCWRQFIGSPEAPQVLTSPVGALGMMQINGRVWRGLYDLDKLASDVDYNVAAGAAILEQYLVDYAIRRGEHEQPGGDDNLIRATYAAYNGGPSHLSRYRRDDTASRLRAIDEQFWRHYTTIKSGQGPDVSSCY